MPYALGFDSSTQSFSAVLLDLSGPKIAADLSIPFSELPEYESPRGFLENLPEGQVHADPRLWLAALELLLGKMKEAGWPLAEVVAISGSGQQHGSVYLKEGFAERLAALDPALPLVDQLQGIFSRATSPIWMDVSTSAECAEITSAAGGAEAVCARSGSVAVERFTGPQIRAFSKRDPQGYAETTRIHLVSSFLCSVIAGRDAAIDTGDGAGMNLMDLARTAWDPILLDVTAPDLARRLPEVGPGSTVAGTVSPYLATRFGINPEAKVLLFTGDNPASLVGMGAAGAGRVVISLGTSDVLFAAMEQPRTDPEGCGHVFGNPLGGYMTLAVIRNGSLAREAFRDQLGADWTTFEKSGDAILPADAVCLPFVTAEITPKRAGGLYESHPDLSTDQRIRAFLEGQAFNLLRQLDWMDLRPTEICLTGGASKNQGIAQVYADVFGVPVSRLSVPNSAALGAAMRAALAAGSDLAALETALSHPDSTVQPRQAGEPIRARYQLWLTALKQDAPAL